MLRYGKILAAVLLVAATSLGTPGLTGEVRAYTSNDATGFTYTAQWGDSLWRLSRRFGVSLEAIQAANGLWGDWLPTGSRL